MLWHTLLKCNYSSICFCRCIEVGFGSCKGEFNSTHDQQSMHTFMLALTTLTNENFNLQFVATMFGFFGVKLVSMYGKCIEVGFGSCKSEVNFTCDQKSMHTFMLA